MRVVVTKPVIPEAPAKSVKVSKAFRSGKGPSPAPATVKPNAASKLRTVDTVQTNFANLKPVKSRRIVIKLGATRRLVFKA